MNENLLLLLRSVNAGYENVLESPSGEYYCEQIKFMPSLLPSGSEIKSIESRLQFELFGEYPLSEGNQQDWDRNIKGAFNFEK